MYVKEMPNLHTHTQHILISDSFGVVKFCSLRGEGRVKNGVRMNHMITLEEIEFSFVDILNCN